MSAPNITYRITSSRQFTHHRSNQLESALPITYRILLCQHRTSRIEPKGRYPAFSNPSQDLPHPKRPPTSSSSPDLEVRERGRARKRVGQHRRHLLVIARFD
eukprot:1619774-Rhodomonas_salina.1